MHRQETFHRFQLKNNPVFNDQIKAITHIDTVTFVFDRQFQLTDKPQIARTQFNTKTLVISRLKQARSKNTMHIDCGADNLLG